MSATQELSVGLQDVAGRLNEDLALMAGEPVAWVLVCQVDDVAQYVSNTDRKDGAALIESLLERWKAGRADIPAHYNPDLRPPREGGDAQPAVTSDMVTRFLSWKLPEDFAPDCGITFKPLVHGDAVLSWPTGTNLLTGHQARAMLEHVLAVGAEANP